tara:strand:- start:91 stop:669 length:579 start_codon:yes stop_codon:yes gene_type:complete
MENADSFINWGFAPSKQASGWVFQMCNKYWYSDMRARDIDVYAENIYSLDTSLISLATNIILEKCDMILYEWDKINEVVAEFDVGGALGDINIKLLGDDIILPNAIEYWFPETVGHDDEDEIREIIEPIVEDTVWLDVGIRKLVEERVGDITNSEIVKRVETGKLTPYIAYVKRDGWDDIDITAIYLQKIIG